MDFVKNAMSGGSKDSKSSGSGEQKQDYVDKGAHCRFIMSSVSSEVKG